MSKRSGDPFITNNISKRKKIDNPDETLWDDDLDDNCFDEIANKIFEKDDVVQATQENSSILLSYDSFKPNIPFASTQDIPTPTNGFKIPQTVSTNEDMKMKLTYLQQKCEAKEGEVSILRAQMKKIKSDMVEDQSKKQREYLEITNSKEKEIKSIKGQLDFKDLEIANLKQKILEITKNNNINNSSSYHDMSSRQKSYSSSKVIFTYNREKTSKVFTEREKDFETSILLEQEHIVYSKGVSDFFESFTPEIHVVETRVNQFGRNTIPYLHNQMVQEELTLPPGPKLTAKIDDEDITLEHIYSEVFDLFQNNISENNSEVNNNSVNRLLGVSIQLLKNFIHYLDQLENVYRTEDIEQLDRLYLQRNSKEYDNEKQSNNTTTNCEIGVRAGRTIRVIAELLPYNDYMKDLLVSNKEINENFSCHDYLKDLRKKDFYFLLLNDIVRKIFSLRKSQACNTFLQSVASLLLIVSKENLYHNICPAFTSLIASLLFTRPSTDIIYKLLVIIKNCSVSKNFLDFLCQKPECKRFTIDKKRKLNYFSEDSCKFTIFVSLLNNTVQDMREEELLDVTLIVLSFVDNIFTTNSYWVHDQQKDRCTCLEQLYQLIIEVLYWTQLKFQKNNSPRDKYISIFKCGVRVLELLSFNSYDSIEKFIDNYSRYKEICKNFMEMKEDLNLTEEIIAELLPYNDYMKDLLVSNKEINENFSCHDYLKDLRKKDFYFLLLNDIVRKIFSLRKSQACNTFLQSVASLLLIVSKENLYHNICPAFTSLIASLLFTRPSTDIIYKLLVIIKNCSVSKNFLDFLCQKPECKRFTIDKKRKLNYFSEDSCKFTIFVSLLNNTVQDMREEELLDVTLIVLSFVDNIFTTNSYWVHDQQKDRCTCLEQLYQLIIEVLYWTQLKFQKNNSPRDKYISIFKCGVRVLELLSFNSYDSIEKFIDNYSRYKEICKNFMEMKEDLNLTEETCNLEKLCLSEEVLTVPSSSFGLI